MLRHPGVQHDQPHGVRGGRPQSPLVVAGEELGLVGGHVDVDRAVPLAALARQAQLQRLVDLLAAEAVFDRLALEHLEQDPRAPPRGVLLVEGHHVARAHRAALDVAALAGADASGGGVGEAPAVLRVGEVRVRLGRVVFHPQLEVGHDPVGLDDLPRVHLPVGVPDRLELPERLHELVAVELGQQLTAGLAVAVLARERAAVVHDQV